MDCIRPGLHYRLVHRSIRGLIPPPIDVIDLTVRAAGEYDLWHRISQLPQARLALAYRFICPFAFDHVVNHGPAHNEVPAVILERRSAEKDGQNRPVFTEKVELEIVNYPRLNESREILLEALQTLGSKKIIKVFLADNLIARVPQPLEFGVVDQNEQAVFIERVVTAGRMVVEIVDFLR